jgi:Zn-dependent metalloprotease
MRYGCLCAALPRKLVAHLADHSADPDDRQNLHEQNRHAGLLRGQRHAAGRVTPSTRRAVKPLQRSVFTAQGRTLLPGQLLRDEDDPATPDAAANAAYENVGIALQFLKTVLGRNSLDNKGMRVDASVHYGFRFVNAMWTGEQMIVGDGDGQSVAGLAASLGIIAHEMAHGISQHLIKGGLGVVLMPGAPPTLKGEAGALNESFSDVFASMVKQWHHQQDVTAADWLLGEDILKPKAGKAIRSLSDPGNQALTWKSDDQIRDFRRFKATMDAHTGSGIANYAFYLAAMDLGGHSWDNLGLVWLKAFDRLRARATFLDAAHATVDVAAALHGRSSPAHKAVKAGWKAVKVLT